MNVGASPRQRYDGRSSVAEEGRWTNALQCRTAQAMLTLARAIVTDRGNAADQRPNWATMTAGRQACTVDEGQARVDAASARLLRTSLQTMPTALVMRFAASSPGR